MPVRPRLWVQGKGFLPKQKCCETSHSTFSFLSFLTWWSNKSTTDIGNTDALLPLLTDIVLREGKEEFKNRYLAYLEALREAGIEFDSSIADPSTLTGSIQNVSEETGGIIAGRLNAVVINQAEGVSVMRQQLLVQYEMRNSLAAIQSDVNTIKQRIGNTATPNPYLYRGIL